MAWDRTVCESIISSHTDEMVAYRLTAVPLSKVATRFRDTSEVPVRSNCGGVLQVFTHPGQVVRLR